MPALSAPNATLWRTPPYRFTGYLYIDRPEVVFKARVNQASFTYPLVQVTFDTVTVGAYTDVKKNFTVLFGSSEGASDLGVQRVRKVPTSTVLYIGESSQGDHEGEVDLADNMYITVLNERRIWGVPPRFDKEDATAFKDYEIEVDSGGRNYASHPGPKANGGAWRIALADTGTGLATFDFSDESLYVTPGSVFASRAWDKKDGTITVGTSTSANPTMTFGVGRRYVELTVTDSNGHTDTHYILVVVLSLTDATWKPIRQFEITDRRLTDAGGELSVIVHEDIAYSTYYEGAAVLYFESEIYGSTAGSLAGPATIKQVQFVGWLDTERESPTATMRGIQKGTELRCISAAERLRQINLLPQLVKYKGSPDEWDELAGMTNVRVLWYLLRWHSTVLEVCNLLIPGWESLIKRWATTASTLYEQAAEAAKARGCLFTCDQRGILRVVPNSLILSSATGERTSTVIVALTEADYSAIDLERNPHPNTYWIDGSGITIGTDTEDIVPMFARAPGDAPGQGSQRSSFSGLIVDGHQDLNDWTGNEYARVNAPWLPIRLRMRYTGDAGIDPALGEWITLSLPSTTNRRGRSFSTQRCMPVEVSISYSNDATNTKEVDLTVVVETEGSPAATVEVEKGGGNITIWGTVDDGLGISPVITPGGPGGYQLYKGLDNIVGVNSDGYVYTTSTFKSTVPTWARSAPGFTGSPVHFVVDAFSPLYTGSGSTVNGWIATTSRIYRIVDIFGAKTITSQKTLRASSSKRSLDSPFGLGASGRVYCVSAYDDGVYETHTTDGSTWSTETLVGSTPGYTWEYDIDFTASNGSFAAVLGNRATYTAGVGWQRVFNVLGAGHSETRITRTVSFFCVECEVTYNAPSGKDALTINTTHSPTSDVGGVALIPVAENVTFVRVDLNKNSANVTLDITRIKIRGTGANPFTGAAAAAGPHPGVHGSTKLDGRVYTSAYVSGGADGFKSTDHGATLTQIAGTSPDIAPVSDLAGEIHVPWNNNADESIVYHGSLVAGVRRLVRVVGTTISNVSPSVGYGPWKGKWQVNSAASNRNEMAVCAGNAAQTLAGVWISHNGGDSWTELVAPTSATTRYERCAISGDDVTAMYLWGIGGAVGFYDGTAVIDRRGNITADFLSIGEFVGIAGG